MYMCVFIYMHIHTYIHTCIHIYTCISLYACTYLRGAVRGHDGQLVRHPELVQNVRRRPHDREVGVAAHDDAHLFSGFGFEILGFGSRVSGLG